MKGILVLTASLVLFAFLSSCVTTEDYQSLRHDLNQVKSDYYSDIRTLKVQMKRIEGTAENAPSRDAIKGLKESQETLYNQLTNLRTEMQLIQGKLDENSYTVEKALRDSSTERDLLRAGLAELKTAVADLKTRIEALEERLKGTGAEAAEEAGNEKKEEAKKPMTPQYIYHDALNLFNEGKTTEAREALESFLKRYPSMELSDNAQFWIAESYYKEGNYEDAILSYENLIKKFPKSDKVPGAMLKQAFAFRALGDLNTTRVILSTLKERFPDSKEAEIATKKLKKIEKKKRAAVPEKKESKAVQ